MLNDIKKYMNRPMVSLGLFAVVAVVMILISFLALEVPVVAVCSIVILEVLIAALLNRIPIWIHGLILIAEIIAGIICGKALFMILMALVYVVAVAILYLWAAKEQ